MESVYYEKPYQVIFIREVDGKIVYHTGIGFHEWVVDGDDGAAFKTGEILVLARRFNIDEDYCLIESFEWGPIEVI